ncbi:MAG: LysE family transporter [Bacteroidia bacterium]|jgi:threonine/homoserine/homoserine lactone efflux protein
MITSITQGIVLGIILSFLIGPVFFLLLKLSMEQGQRQAAIFDVGVIASDVVVILLAYFGLSEVMQNPVVQKTIGTLGGAILIITAIVALIKRNKQPSTLTPVLTKKSTLMRNGFLLNISNPFVWLFWIASIGGAAGAYAQHKVYIINYFVACIITCIAFDVLKIKLATFLKQFLTPKRLLNVNIGVQLFLIAFGIMLIVKVFVKL